MFDLTSALAWGLADALESPPVRKGLLGTFAQGGADKTVLQLNALPVPVDIALYRDSFAPDNPTGSLLAARRFRDLCNTVPAVRRHFDPSGVHIEEVWRQIVFGAAADSTMTRQLLSRAQEAIQNYELADLGGFPSPWLPVDANPSGWADLIDDAPEFSLDLDPEGSGEGYQVLGDAGGLTWTNGAGETVPVEGRLHRIRLKAIKVDLLRHWLDFQLLSLGQWRVEGHPAGFYSTGDVVRNVGIFPLLPTSIVIGQKIEVEGALAPSDTSLIDRCTAGGVPLSLGPFPVVAGHRDTSRTKYVIGYTSRIVPNAPQLSGAPSGSVTVRNDGGFIARFTVDWREDGRKQTEESGNFLTRTEQRIAIAQGARDIQVRVEVMTLPRPLERWKTVQLLHFDGPLTKAYRLTGTTMQTDFTEYPTAGVTT